MNYSFNDLKKEIIKETYIENLSNKEFDKIKENLNKIIKKQPTNK